MLNRRQFVAGGTGSVLALGMQRATAADKTRITVILDWLLNPNHAGLFAAQHGGAFDRAGLDVRLIAPSDPDSPTRLVAAGQADLALSYGSQINMITAAGLPVVRVATLIGQPLNTIMATGNIRTLADLKGKTIGYSVAGVEEAVLSAMMATAGLQTGDFSTIKVNYNMIPALISHRLDAATGAYRNAELIQARQMGLTPTVFLPEEHGIPLYDELLLVARRDRLTDPALPRFIKALAEGVALARANPEGLWSSFAAANTDLDTPYNHLSWQATVPLLAQNPGYLDRTRYQAFADFCVAHSIVTQKQSLEAYAVQLVS